VIGRQNRPQVLPRTPRLVHPAGDGERELQAVETVPQVDPVVFPVEGESTSRGSKPVGPRGGPGEGAIMAITTRVRGRPLHPVPGERALREAHPHPSALRYVFET